MKKASGDRVVCENRKARFDYHIEDTMEAGIELKGTEVKSLREGKANLKDSYATISGDEMYLVNCHISPYDHGNIYNHEPDRSRKLLLHRGEIRRLAGKINERGYTLVPLKIYFTRGIAKVELALAKGKKLYDKREEMKRKDIQKEMERAVRDHLR